MEEKVSLKKNEVLHPLFPSGEYEKIENEYVFVSWWWVLVVLLVVFVLLKKFIYLEDESKKDL